MKTDANTLVIGDTYPYTNTDKTREYTEANGWSMTTTIYDALTPESVSLESVATYDHIRSLWVGTFPAQATLNLSIGNSTITIRFTKPDPLNIGNDIINTVLTGHALNCIVSSAPGVSDLAYYSGMLADVRATLKARVSGGVAEYTVADYSMKYIDLAALQKMELYYIAKVDEFSNPNSAPKGPLQVRF